MQKNDNSERILITGGTGFIGTNLTRTLVARNKHVYVIVRNKKLSWRLRDIASKLALYECDILNSSLQKVIDKIRPTHIFHLAAYGVLPHENNLKKMVEVNLLGTINLISAIKKHDFRIFINTGSGFEYGIKNRPMNELDMIQPTNDYGVTKASVTHYCIKEAVKNKLPIISFRLFTPYGYYEYKKRLIPSILLSILRGEPIRLSSPTHVRDFIFIEDVIDAYIQATNVKFTPGEIYNIASGKQHSVKDVVSIALRVSGSNVQLEWGKVSEQKRYIEPSINIADISKAKKQFDWKPKTSLESGIKKTLAWFFIHRRRY